MASYWRSPYREASTNAFPNPDHSTLKFEQSLYLSRSRSLLNNSTKYEWLDSSYSSPSPNTYRHPVLTRSNTNIKGILKIPKRDDSLFPRKQPETNDLSEESNTSNGDTEKKENGVKKRVTFGINETCEGGSNQSDSGYSQSKRCQLKAMKRISHSRLLEESAMKKLNRLIGGSTMVTENRTLPSVKGTSLLSPRNSADVAKLQKLKCGHGADLSCIRCIRSNIENGHDERIHGKANVYGKFFSKPNHPLQSSNKTINDSNNNATNSMQTSEGFAKDWPTLDEAGKENEENDYCETPLYDYNDEEIRHRTGSASATMPSGYSRKECRLLPGRYPFTAGAMQIKKLSIQDIQKAQRGDSTLKADLIDLHRDRSTPNTKQNKDKSTNNDVRLTQPTNRGTDTRIESTAFRIPAITPVSTTNVNNEPNSTTTGKVNNNNNNNSTNHEYGGYDDSDNDNDNNNNKNVNDNPIRNLPNDKTTGILEWLNDVHKKQSFKPRVSRIYACSETT